MAHFDLLPCIRFNTTVDSARWSKEDKMWVVSTVDGTEYTANFLIQGTGQMTAIRKPHIEGKCWLGNSVNACSRGDNFRLKGAESYRGVSFHSAEWPDKLDLAGKRVGIIGTGATTVQVAPAIADKVEQLHVFQRSATWVLPLGQHDYPLWVKVMRNSKV